MNIPFEYLHVGESGRVVMTIGCFWKSVKDYFHSKKRPRIRIVDPETHEEIGPYPKGFQLAGDWNEKFFEYDENELREMYPDANAALSTAEICPLCLNEAQICECTDFELSILRANLSDFEGSKQAT